MCAHTGVNSLITWKFNWEDFGGVSRTLTDGLTDVYASYYLLLCFVA